MSTRRDALATASMAAARLHQDMNTRYDRPVDVFMIAQRLKLWLAAQPLDRAYGFYLRQANVAGIVLNSRHPETLQRYTCAHEIGHHILGHQSHADDETTVELRTPADLQERQAQVFASALLMPAPLVNQTLRRLTGTQHTGPRLTGTPRLQPQQVYAASRDMQVSYTAAVWGLVQLNKLDQTTAAILARRGPRTAKDALRGGSSLTDARADVWLLDDSSADGTTITCRVGDEIHIRLTENLSTGHIWQLDDRPHPLLAGQADDFSQQLSWDGDAGLAPAAPPTPVTTSDAGPPGDSSLEITIDTHVGSSDSDLRTSEQPLFDLDDPKVAAAPGEADELTTVAVGTRVLVVRPRRIGEFPLRLTLRPAWQPSAPPVDSRQFILATQGIHTLPDQGYANPQLSEWALQHTPAA